MKRVPTTMRKVFFILLVVALLTATLGSGIASASNTAVERQATPSSDIIHWCNYTVRAGDTLYGIARRYGTTIWELARRNGIVNVNYIRTGQHLYVPCGWVPLPPPPGLLCFYRVKRGDTLSRIAVWYRTTVGHLAAVNHIANPNRIYAGQWLRVPCCLRCDP